MDAYIRMTLYDPSTGNTEAFRTSTQINDPSPRYNQKFDFIDVPAISHFTATVFDKSGLIESRLTMTPWKQARETSHSLHPHRARALPASAAAPPRASTRQTQPVYSVTSCVRNIGRKRVAP